MENNSTDDAIPPRLTVPSPASIEHAFAFHGTADGYFRIWVVNIFLTLLTCGVYSARARVRTRRYLLGNTGLMGHRFTFQADPRHLLFAAMILPVILIASVKAGVFDPRLGTATLLAGLALLPWVINRSLTFDAHGTTYRGLRFEARHSYGQTAWAYFGQWFLILLSLGLYYPAAVRHRQKFLAGSHRLDGAAFRTTAKCGRYYSTYLVAGLIVVAGSFLAFVVAAIGFAAWQDGYEPTDPEMIPFFIGFFFAIHLAKHFSYARLFNHQWNNTQINGHRFRAGLPVGGWLKLQGQNFAAILISGGLLYPWAKIRATRYLWAHLYFIPAGPIGPDSQPGPAANDAINRPLAESPPHESNPGVIDWLDARAKIIAGAGVLIFATGLALTCRELSDRAQELAMTVPIETEIMAGKNALVTAHALLAPSQLTRSERLRVETQLDRLIRADGLTTKPLLVYRTLPEQAPNCFDLPGGYIVISDALVAMATNDELAALLAHQLGHWRYHHAMQYVLRHSPILLDLQFFSADWSALYDSANALPSNLMYQGYAQTYEIEAHHYAMALLEKARIRPSNLESILKKLEAPRAKTGGYSLYGKTHPKSSGENPPPDQSGNTQPLNPKTAAPVPPPAPMHPLDSWSLYIFQHPDSPLIMRFRAEPIYPPQLKKSETSGKVTLSFVVDENGDVKMPRIKESSHRDFEAPALQAISEWEFVPAVSAGRNTATKTEITFMFTLDEDDAPPDPE